MIGIIFSCVIDHYDERVPTAVSLTLTQCEAPNNLIKVENDQVNYKGPRHHITACVGQIYNGFDDINQLVEMVEVNHILGVNLVVLYNHTSSAVLDPYIHSFQQEAMLDFYNWYHPLTQRVGDGFFGNFILKNDCLYRYMYRSDYIIMTDLDEVVVPDERYGTLPVLLSKIFKPDISQYTLHRVCFPDNWPSDPIWINDKTAQDYHIRTLLQTERNEFQKPKSILKPEYITIADNHYDSERLYGIVQIVSPSQAKIYHYRNTAMNQTGGGLSVRDVSMHRFAAHIVKIIGMRHFEVLKLKREAYISNGLFHRLNYSNFGLQRQDYVRH